MAQLIFPAIMFVFGFIVGNTAEKNYVHPNTNWSTNNPTPSREEVVAPM